MATLSIQNIPEDLLRKLKARAKSNQRSVGKEVIQILSLAVEGTGEPALGDLRGLGKELWTAIDPAEHVDEERRSWD